MLEMQILSLSRRLCHWIWIFKIKDSLMNKLIKIVMMHWILLIKNQEAKYDKNKFKNKGNWRHNKKIKNWNYRKKEKKSKKDKSYY